MIERDFPSREAISLFNEHFGLPPDEWFEDGIINREIRQGPFCRIIYSTRDVTAIRVRIELPAPTLFLYAHLNLDGFIEPEELSVIAQEAINLRTKMKALGFEPRKSEGVAGTYILTFSRPAKIQELRANLEILLSEFPSDSSHYEE